jgi:hypothetical protein
MRFPAKRSSAAVLVLKENINVPQASLSLSVGRAFRVLAHANLEILGFAHEATAELRLFGAFLYRDPLVRVKATHRDLRDAKLGKWSLLNCELAPPGILGETSDHGSSGPKCRHTVLSMLVSGVLTHPESSYNCTPSHDFLLRDDPEVFSTFIVLAAGEFVYAAVYGTRDDGSRQGSD